MNIVITGASKGLGFAIAEAFAADHHPHQFFLCARNENDLAEAAYKLGQKQTHHTVQTQACDITNKEEVNQFANWVLQQTTAIDILVNNTGSFLPGGILSEADGTLETMMNTNFYGAYHLTKALLPNFVQNQKGHIFNICSTAALGAYPGGSSYSISKFALMGFSKNLREELKDHNIKVTTVYPGSFYSDSWKESDIDPKRIMETADMANMIFTAAHLSPQACVEEIVLRPQLGNV